MHQERKETKNQDNIKVAAPNTNYCQICKEKYENYFVHIYQEQHMNLLKENPINSEMEDLSLFLSQRTKK